MFFVSDISAQNNITSSPYSLYGIGDPLSLNNTRGLSMGDLKYAIAAPFYLNSANPASYGMLKAPTFSVAAMLSRTRTFNSETSQDNDNGTLRYFGLGIPLNKKVGMAIGAKPFTSLGYGIQINSAMEYPSNLVTRYEGQGGMNIIYGGLGYTIISDSLSTLSVGANANFYLGNKKQSAFNFLDNNTGALNSMFTSESLTTDFGFDIGLQYQMNVSHLFHANNPTEQKLTIGGTYSLPTDLKTQFENFSGAFYSTGTGAIVITDTLSYQRDTSSIFMPQHYGVGITYDIYNRHSKAHWVIGLEYETFNWSALEVNNQTTSLKDSKQYSFGLEFTPKSSELRSLFKMMSYRVGAKYKDTRIDIANNQLTDMSLSAGFGIPLVRSKSMYSRSSTVDFGFEVGSRGTTENSLIREQYTNIYIGLSFAPNFWDRWFTKRKIN